MTSPLDWTLAVSEIGDGAVARERTASAAERTALAAALEILACEALSVRYRVEPAGRTRFRMTGAIEADVTQACIVTLDPLAAHISEPVAVELLSEEDFAAEIAARAGDVLEAGDIEPVIDGRIEIGRIVFELLSAALDPYPRRPDAEFDWTDPKAGPESEPAGPFAALAKLKKQ